MSIERHGYWESFHFSRCHYRSKVSKAETAQELHMTVQVQPHTCINHHLFGSIHLLPVRGPSSYKEKSWTSALDRWLERGCCNQTDGEDLTTPSNSLHPPCAAPAVNLHLICAEAWLKPPLLFWWSLWVLLIWTEKFFCFLLFSCIDLAVCVFQAGSVPSSTTMKHKAPLRVSTKKK